MSINIENSEVISIYPNILEYSEELELLICLRCKYCLTSIKIALEHIKKHDSTIPKRDLEKLTLLCEILLLNQVKTLIIIIIAILRLIATILVA